MTATVTNTKTSGLVKENRLWQKTGEIQKKITDHDHNNKYITTQKFDKLTEENFKERFKQADLVSKTDFDNKLISFNRKITSNNTKYLNVQKLLNSITTKVYNFFLSTIYFTSNDGSQKMFVYHPTLNTSESKKYKGTYYFVSWKSKGVNVSELKPLYTACLHSIKISEYKMRIKFDKDPLAVEQNTYATKIVNSYIVYDLDGWPRNPTNNFKFKNCLFGSTNIVKKKW